MFGWRAGLEVVGCAQNLAGLLQRVFNLAGCEESSCCGVRRGIFCIAVDEPELVVVDDGGIECADGTGRERVSNSTLDS